MLGDAKETTGKVDVVGHVTTRLDSDLREITFSCLRKG